MMKVTANSESATFRSVSSFARAATLFIATMALTGHAHALISITTIERASIVDTATSTAGVSTLTVYGGIAGATDRCDGATGSSTTSTCNNCRLKDGETASGDSLLLPCNERRINPNLLLSISFSSDATAGTAAITSSDGNTALTAASGAGVAVAKGQLATIQIPWSTICTRIFADASDAGDAAGCLPASGKVSGVIRVGVTPSATGLLNASSDDVKNINIVVRSMNTPSLAENCASAGSTWQICYFEMGPGDGKAVVRTLLGPSSVSFPATDYKYVRFLYTAGGFNEITLASSHTDLPISASDTTTFSVSPRRIEGLTNDTLYSFKSALVDVAGNVGLYSQASNDSDCSNAAVATTTCRQITPSEVVGVLDKTNCFIATAAYGTQFASELDTLRDFRDQILMATDAGRKFIRFYYDNSPRYARMIAESPVARATVRIGLLPVVWFAGMVLAYGPVKAGLALLASLILVFALISIGRRPEFRAAAMDGFNEVKERARRSLLPLLLGALLVPALAPHRAEAAKTAETASKAATAAKNKHPKLVALEDELGNDESILDPFEDETPPEPEYPYPGAQGTTTPETPIDELPELVPEAPPAPKPRAHRPSPLQRAEQKFGTERPSKITDDGEYIYETLPEIESKQYGPAETHRFSGQPGRLKPATITADGEFTYPVEVSPFTGAAGIRIAMLGAPGITNQTNGVTFKNMYGGADIPGLLFEYEYPLTQAIGRIGIKFETGAYYAQANGRFLNAARASEIPEERFTFLMVPLQAMIHYRFQFWDSQLVVPFVEGGAAYNGVAEIRDDNKPPRVGGAPALIVSGGMNILLDWMDRHSVRQLDAEYGINHVWLTAQYRQIIGLKKEIDFTTHLISVGFTFDF